jgi:hypothetical protein
LAHALRLSLQTWQHRIPAVPNIDPGSTLPDHLSVHIKCSDMQARHGPAISVNIDDGHARRSSEGKAG